MSLYFVGVTDDNVITSFYNTTNCTYNPLEEVMNLVKSELLEAGIPVTDQILGLLDEGDIIIGYMDGEFVVLDAEKIRVGKQTIVKKNNVHDIYSFKRGRNCYYLVGYHHVCRVDKNKEVKSLELPKLFTVFDGEVYYNIGKELVKLDDEMRPVLVHKYPNNILEVVSSDDELLVRCEEGIYIDHELVIKHENTFEDEFYFGDEYVSIQNKLYDINGKLLYSLEGGEVFTNIIDDYAIIDDKRVLHIPTRKIVFGANRVCAYYV